MRTGIVERHHGLAPVAGDQNALAEAAKAGVEVLADDFSLRERGIPEERLATGIKAAPLSTVIDHLADGRKAIWH